MFGDKQRHFAIMVFLFFYCIVHNWCHCNKPTDCQFLVCKSFIFIYCIYAQTFKQFLSLPVYPFGSINHFCHQSQKPWTNTSKKAIFRSWRPILLLTLCSLVIKIWSHYSISRWLTFKLMVGTLFSHALMLLTYEKLWQGETPHMIFRWFIGHISFASAKLRLSPYLFNIDHLSYAFLWLFMNMSQISLLM